ncbi:PREDICTED: uncharacterized protein LOC105119820, partial [Populus euphratica]|uniref:Uncharacterized protein LOC105119820 n=1 Tax=Populus euphratica TaxID=75702 RepID=A0AAJ6XF52_POPEU
MPFGLKNAGATYQRAMLTLFHDMMHQEVEVYVGDILAKSKKEEDHVLLFECTNNTAEYEACIIGLEAALELKAKKLEVFGDSLLIIYQVKVEWKTKDEKLKLYQSYLLRLANEFEEIKFTHISRDKNQFADALATLASMTQVDAKRPINPKASNGHRFILVAIDYFTKWVEANSYAHVTQKVVKRFIEKDLVYRYGLPARLIKHFNSSPYRPKMNGAVEAANKNLKKIIQKMVVTYKDWHEMLPYALHAYRTTVRTSTNATPYSLVYGMEVIVPLEVEIPPLRILKDAELDESEWARSRFKQLTLIDERRLAAICHHQLYQSRIAKAYNKKVKPR